MGDTALLENAIWVCGKQPAKEVKAFNQMQYIGSHWDNNQGVEKGVCRGLVTAYLVRNFTNGVVKDGEGGIDDFWCALDFGRGKFFQLYHDRWGEQSAGDKKRFGVIKAYQEHFKIDDYSDLSVSLKSITGSVERGSKGMLLADPGVTHALPASSKFIGMLPNEPGYWYVSTGNHAMALVIRKPSREVRKCKFFDPNAGEVIYNDAAAMNAFLKVYFRSCNYDQVTLVRFRCGS